MKLRNIVGMNLRYYRFLAGKTQEQFYEDANLNYKYLSRIENGKVNMTVDFIDSIAVKLNLSTSDLITYKSSHIIKKERKKIK